MAPAFVVLARLTGLGFLLGAGFGLFRCGGRFVLVGIAVADGSEVGAGVTFTISMGL